MDAERTHEPPREADEAESSPPAGDRSLPATDASLLELPGAESTTRAVGDVDLHVVAAGDPDDPLVVLLHGFPEFWYSWRHQLEPLVDAGYRVLAPDQRGYNLSDAPEGLDAYSVAELSADVAALVASEDRASAHVVGHDWGGVVAWDLALRRPEVVDRLAVLNAPHPTAFRDALRSNPRQLLRSWYAFWFQLPALPEWLLSRRGYAGLRRAMVGTAAPGTLTDEDLAAYRSAWAEPGALTSMLNWYRALVRRPDRPPRERVPQPTRIVWGDADSALLPELASSSLDYCDDGDLDRFGDASHWVHQERPDDVNASVLDHLDA